MSTQEPTQQQKEEMAANLKQQMGWGEPIELPEFINTADLSELSKDVLMNFGLEAPASLNKYSNVLEDSLVRLKERLTETELALENASIRQREAELETMKLQHRLNLVTTLIKRERVQDIESLLDQPL